MNHRLKAFRVCGSLLTALWLGGGCQTGDPKQSASSDATAESPSESKAGAGQSIKNSVTGLFNPSQVTVTIPFENTEAEVLVKLSHFPANQHAIDGVAALQTGQWEAAEAHFEAALREKPNNWSYHFALAVTQERNGKYAEAKKHYLDANRLKGGGEGHFDAQAGLKRIEARGP